LLPADQGQEFRTVWEEFEAGETANAQFAKALDCLQPLLHNWQTQGSTWRIHQVQRAQVVQRMQAVKVGLPVLWDMVEQIIDEAVELGYLHG
jgi:putative hydrolase of HD superfamily